MSDRNALTRERRVVSSPEVDRVTVMPDASLSKGCQVTDRIA